MAKTYFDIRKLRKLQREVKAGSSGLLRPVFRQWASMYLTWTKRLFIKNRSGSGEWQPLKQVSYKRATGSGYYKSRSGKSRNKSTRMKLRAKFKATAERVSILYDTKTLFGGLTIGAPGNLFKYLVKKGGGIRVGFGGPDKHGDGNITIAAIAKAHQTGNPKTNLPQRKILHEPDQPFKHRMLLTLKKGLKRMGRSL